MSAQLEWRWNRPPDASGNGQRCCNLCRTGIVVNGPIDAVPDLIRCLQCGAMAPADTKPTPMQEESSMSGPARTALVTVEFTFRMTDTATEGEMVDAALCAVKDARPTLKSPNGKVQVGGIAVHVTTKHTGGSL